MSSVLREVGSQKISSILVIWDSDSLTQVFGHFLSEKSYCQLPIFSLLLQHPRISQNPVLLVYVRNLPNTLLIVCPTAQYFYFHPLSSGPRPFRVLHWESAHPCPPFRHRIPYPCGSFGGSYKLL